MPKLSKELIQQIVDLRREGLSHAKIARRLKISESTVSKYSRKYNNGGVKGPLPSGKVGDIVDRLDSLGKIDLLTLDRPATEAEMIQMAGVDTRVWIPNYYKNKTWQTAVKNEDGHAEKVQHYQSSLGFKRIIAEEIQAAIMEFVESNVPSLPPDHRPRNGGGNQVVSWGLWDAHLGMYAWHSEVGENFDLSIAVQRVKNSIDDMFMELDGYDIAQIWMPVGNDFMHYDSVRKQTAFGNHQMDTDHRYQKVYVAAFHCLSYMIETAARLCDDIQVLYIPGNHDMTSSFTLVHALRERYRQWDCVSFEMSANPRKYRRYGGTLLGFDHGQGVKPNQYPMILGTEAKEHWSASTYREVQIGHKHQRWDKMYEGTIPTNGVLVRRNPSLSNVDAWHHNQGFLGEPMKSVEAWRYDKVGYRGSHVTWARDE